MKSSLSIAGLLVVLAMMTLTSCNNEITPPPEDPNSSLSKDADLIVPDTGNGKRNPNFSAILNARNEVPARESRGRGVAKMHINRTHDSIFYFINASNLSNIVAAHVHRGAPGVNGPVVVGLYSAAPAGGRAHGRLTEGVFTPANLVGPYAGSVDFSMFLQDLHIDSLYVNVHTDDGVAPANTGTGDFPGGEIRGQLRSGPDGGIGQKPKNQ